MSDNRLVFIWEQLLIVLSGIPQLRHGALRFWDTESRTAGALKPLRLQV